MKWAICSTGDGGAGEIEAVDKAALQGSWEPEIDAADDMEC